MIYVRNTVLGFALLIFIVFTFLLTPTSHAYILNRVTSYFLQTSAKFYPPHITWNTYRIDAHLDHNSSFTFFVDYTHFKSVYATLQFDGDIELFSKVADTQLPHVMAKLNARLGLEQKIIANATLLEGSLNAKFDLNNFTYSAEAKNLNLYSFQEQQKILPYVDGEIAFVSRGVLSDVMEINLSLQSAHMHLLEPSLALIAPHQKDPAPLHLNTHLNLKDTKLYTHLDLNSTLAQLTFHSLNYEIKDGDFDTNLTLINRLKAYEPLQNLQIQAQGHYADDTLKSAVHLNADGYRVDLNELSYEAERLFVKYALHSNHQAFADIRPEHQIIGTAIYTPERTEANITSALLKDTIRVEYNNPTLKIKTDALSLAGLLTHLKQEPLATAALSLNGDVNLSDPLKWQALLNTSDLKLSETLTDVLGHNDTIALELKAFSANKSRIIIHPKISSSMMHLEQSEIIYDLNHSIVTMESLFEDLNISYYHAPTLSLNGRVDLNEPLKLNALIKSPYEALKLTLSKEEKSVKSELIFDLHTLNRFAFLEEFNHLSGAINVDSLMNEHFIRADLKDINSSFYSASFMNIDGSLKQSELLKGTFNIRTPYEKVYLNFKHDANRSDADFNYDITRLDRFAALNPQYDINGSGQLTSMRDQLTLALDSKQFGMMTFDQEKDDITIDVNTFNLKEIFLLTNQKAVVDANISLHAEISPSHIKAEINSPLIQPTDLNASFRPTTLNTTLNLDGNRTHYHGIMEIKTDKEHLTFNHLTLSPPLELFSTDFTFISDDLEHGTPVLPDFLMGSTHFDGYVTYDDSLVVHINNQLIEFSEPLHKMFDKNASGSLNLKLSADLSYANDTIDLKTKVASPYFSVDTFKTHVDLNNSHLTSTLKLETDLWQKDTAMNLTMHYDNPIRLDVNATTAYETLRIKDITIDTKRQHINGSYQLLLEQSASNAFIKHGDAAFYGKLSNHPTQQATLESISFGGHMKIVLSQLKRVQSLSIASEEILLDKVMQFLDLNSSLKSGNLDLHGTLYSKNFLEFNTSTIKATLLMDATELLLEGVDADKSIDLLKNYQDISIFEGNFPGKGIITSVIKAPVKLINDKEIKTSTIERIYVDSYVQDGAFHCYDCAVKTKENRIAIKGAIELNTTNFQNFEIGLVKKNGCAFFTQQIKGDVSHPEIKLSKASLTLITGTLKSVGNLAMDGVDLGTSLLSKAGALVGDIVDTTTDYIPVVNKVTGVASKTITTVTDVPDSANKILTNECIPFYSGVVQHPKKKK